MVMMVMMVKVVVMMMMMTMTMAMVMAIVIVTVRVMVMVVEHTRNSVFTRKASKQLHSLLLEPNDQVIPLWVQRSTTYL